MNSLDFQETVITWYESNKREFPWRSGSIDPLTGLLTELCLRKTTAQQVCKVYAATVDKLEN